MTSCPFCSNVLLRHIRAGKSYWLCRHCRTEILNDEFTQVVHFGHGHDVAQVGISSQLSQFPGSVQFSDRATQASKQH